MSDGCIPLTIPLKPWFQDHHFGGRAILPAVETMLLLADAAARLYPGMEVRVMEEASFPSFLEVAADTVALAGFVECRLEDDGRLRMALLSRVQFKAMSRLKEHGALVFSSVGAAGYAQDCLAPEADPPDPVTTVPADRIYRELVPFGPSYQTLQGSLHLSGRWAWGRLLAPNLPAEPIQNILGSPFPLDGALHAACVLGQQYVDFVPFPVGFARRLVHRPTVPGGGYHARVYLVARTDGELLFDLWILDDEGRVFETIRGVRMREVSGAYKR